MAWPGDFLVRAHAKDRFFRGKTLKSLFVRVLWGRRRFGRRRQFQAPWQPFEGIRYEGCALVVSCAGGIELIKNLTRGCQETSLTRSYAEDIYLIAGTER
jgi:hypothetical protein